MSVLIKGMEMPKDGTFNIVYIYGDGHIEMPFWGKGMQTIKGVTAVPVPPHGRLIDADAFTKDECNYCDGACEALPCDCLNCEADCRCDFMKDIAIAPTVIPASEEGE